MLLSIKRNKLNDINHNVDKFSWKSRNIGIFLYNCIIDMSTCERNLWNVALLSNFTSIVL